MPYTTRIMRASLLLLTLAVLVGCNTAPKQSPTPTSESASTASPAKTPTVAAPFDFYLLTLSWSPEYCLSNASSPECPAHPGFVVHGMWPENNNGTYPENCSAAPGPTNPSSYLDVLPTLALIQHEWLTHGTCSGLDPNTYFNNIRAAFKLVKIPGNLQNDHTQQSLAPATILTQFASANPAFPRGSFALSCTGNALTAAQVCLTKSLTPEACQHVRTCTAPTIKIPPQ